MRNAHTFAEGTPRVVAKFLYKKEDPMFLAMPAAVQISAALNKDDLAFTVNEGRRIIDNMSANVTSSTDSYTVAKNGQQNDCYEKTLYGSARSFHKA